MTAGTPIKVLHVIGRMDRGGAETLVMNVYRTLDADRFQFDFLVQTEDECDFDAEIRARGGHVFHVPAFVGYNARAYGRACRRFFDQHHDYAAVHGHIGASVGIYLPIAKRWGMFTIVHSHNTNGPLSSLWWRFVRPSYRYADFFLACSEQAGVDRFGPRITAGQNYSIVRNGIDTARYRFDPLVRADYRAKLGLRSDHIVFGHVGRFVKEKNHGFLVDVFARIRQDHPNAVLLLTGRGELEHAIRSKVHALGLDESVRFLGVRDDVPQVLMAMDVFLFPSIREGLPLAVVEAQASGLPCLLSSSMSSEMDAGGVVRRESLSDTPARWEETAFRLFQASRGTDRTRYSVTVAQHGFDIHETAEQLAGLYAQGEASRHGARGRSC